MVRRHWIFFLVATPALLLRADAELGYRWQSWFNDSFSYVRAAVLLVPEPQRVSGYPLLLWLVSPLHSFAVITILQHVAGLGIGACVYWQARRFGVRPWVAALAAVPVLYDGFQIQLEHLIMADTAYETPIIAAVAVILDPAARRDPGRRPAPPGAARESGGVLGGSSPPANRASPPASTAALTGVLLGLAVIIRSAALPLVAVFVVYLLVIRAGWLVRLRAVGALVTACALPVVGYAGWFDSEHGHFAMTDSTGVFLYSRVMTFADCGRMGSLSPQMRALCPTVPAAERPPAEEYIWRNYSPLVRYDPSPFNAATNTLAKQFAYRAIESQPLDYARVVADDVWKAFDWSRTPYPDPTTYDMYLFGYSSVPVPTYATGRIHGYTSYEAYYARGNPLTHVVNPFAAIIRGYQRYVWLPGTVFGLILLAGLVGIVMRWRRGPGRDALLPWGLAAGMIAGPAATAGFDYRYVLPAVPLACLAAAMTLGAPKAADDKRDLALDTTGTVVSPGGQLG